MAAPTQPCMVCGSTAVHKFQVLAMRFVLFAVSQLDWAARVCAVVANDGAAMQSSPRGAPMAPERSLPYPTTLPGPCVSDTEKQFESDFGRYSCLNSSAEWFECSSVAETEEGRFDASTLCCACGGGCLESFWSDNYGHTCYDYHAEGWCSASSADGYGLNWLSDYGTFEEHSSSSPLRACCKCGGGRPRNPSTTTTSTSPPLPVPTSPPMPVSTSPYTTPALAERIQAIKNDPSTAWLEDHVEVHFEGNRSVNRIHDNGYEANLIMDRPSWLKSYRCRGDSCEECSGASECMGIDPDAGRIKASYTGANGIWERMGFNIVVDCPLTALTLVLIFGHVQGGVLRSRWNDLILNSTHPFALFSYGLESPFENIEEDGSFHYSHMILRPDKAVGNKWTLDFTLDSIGASMDIAHTDMIVNAAFAQCEDSKTCLSRLGDFGEPGLRVRASNLLQFKCMNGLALPEELHESCAAWMECLTRGNSTMADELAMILAAAGMSVDNVASLAEVRKEDLVARADSMCVYPPNEDIESWDCSCAQDALARCQLIEDTTSYVYSETICLRTQMCNNPRICMNWFNEFCKTEAVEQHNDSLHASLIARRSQVSRKARTKVVKQPNDSLPR